MNISLLLKADRATHVRIVMVALAFATLVVGISLAARLNLTAGQTEQLIKGPQALNWLMPSFILRGILWFSTRLIIGAILIAAGAALAIFAVRDFRRAGTNAEPWKPTLNLVTSGIYGAMRNPMYTSMIVFLAGFAIALGSDWMLVLVVPTALILHFGVVRREERYLEAKFGESYRSYMHMVPRYWF
jgi:protein-S-isoprenylcysteine O-methyltransferase Ste14